MKPENDPGFSYSGQPLRFDSVYFASPASDDGRTVNFGVDGSITHRGKNYTDMSRDELLDCLTTISDGLFHRNQNAQREPHDEA